MPIYLKDKSEFPELERFKSVLIVPCRFCPAASMAVRKNKPYFEFLKRFLKTGSYERLLDTIKSKGRIHELSLILQLKSKTRDFFKDAGLGWKMYRRGKIKLFPSRFRGGKEIQEIFNGFGKGARR